MHGVFVASRYGRAYMEAPLRRLANEKRTFARPSRFSRAATNAFRSLFTPIRDTLLRSEPIVSFHSSLLVRGAEEEEERERMWRRIIECFRDAISYANAACLARFVAYFYLPLR